MNDLKILNNQTTIDSREVAKMGEIEHWELLRKLEGTKTRKGIIPILTDNQMSVSEYFIPSTYKDSSGKENKCYLFTKKGCEFIANKFTGEKGILFTARYVERFNELEKGQAFDNLSPQLQLLINMELKQKELENKMTETQQQVTKIKDTFVQQHENWREEINRLFNKVQKATGINFSDLRVETYKKLEERAKCDLSRRLTNLKSRLALQGATKSKINKTSKLDVIENDIRLKEIYTQIIKEYSIKYS